MHIQRMASADIALYYTAILSDDNTTLGYTASDLSSGNWLYSKSVGTVFNYKHEPKVEIPPDD